MLLACVIIFSGVNTPFSIVFLVHMRNTSFLACVIIFSGVNTPFSIVFLVHMRNTSELDNLC